MDRNFLIFCPICTILRIDIKQTVLNVKIALDLNISIDISWVEGESTAVL